ncbi:hypothetical protein CAEBREN_21210 [Caenorhabditis brenneri]|uniref:Uncharacterized protein n=1 Tax=Caenorhabditis brenneri TaxID=135651 RepID=G0N3F2_CAEBE|nr:hypothetical protein CAEBREN_21210 [Caenorhabditis brenneri]
MTDVVLKKEKLKKTDDISSTKSGINGGVAGNAKNAARFIVKKGAPTRVDGVKTANQAGKGVITGGISGAARNAARYLIKEGGTRYYNGVNIFDKAVRNGRGHPTWFARVDYATIKNPQAHINVNRAVTGLKDPHIPLSNVAAQNTATAGKALNVLNKAAPVLTAVAVVYDTYQIGKNVIKDKEYGSKRNTTQKVVTTAATWGGGFGGAAGGATIGTAMLPGIGTLIGGIVGGIVGGIGSSIGSEIATNAAMDAYEFDITYPECKLCYEIFECRVYQTGVQAVCEDCRNREQKISGALSEKDSCKGCGVKLVGSEGNGRCNTCKAKKCSWCGTPDESLERMELEEGPVELCKTCMDALNKEIEKMLNVEELLEDEEGKESENISNGNEGAEKEEEDVDTESEFEEIPAGEVEIKIEEVKVEEEQKVEDQKNDWNCKLCGTTLHGSKTPEGEDELTVLCARCRENEANEILQKKELEELAPPKKIVSFSSKTCKWCDEKFFCKATEENCEFCPKCEALKPKKK